jgi:hypothetical protein
MSEYRDAKKTSPALVLLAWLFVGIPLIWGVSQTFRNAMNLFNSMPGRAVTANPSVPANTAPQVAPAATSP